MLSASTVTVMMSAPVQASFCQSASGLSTNWKITCTVQLNCDRRSCFVEAFSYLLEGGGDYFGSLVIDVDNTMLRTYFLRESGFVDDYFSIYKGSGPPRFERVTATLAANGMMTLSWYSRGDRYYQVERKTDLESDVWAVVDTSLEGTGGIMNWSTPVNGMDSQAFYRVYQYSD